MTTLEVQDVALHTISVCAGIGGIDLGLRGIARTVCYVEREAFAAATLVRHMEAGRLDPAPVWSDASTFDGSAWRGSVDLVAAGFPCQPFSTASRGRRVAKDLWPEVFSIIHDSGANWAFLENVDERPIADAARDLESIGMSTTYDCFWSSEMGAAHNRRRWWLLANADSDCEPVVPFHAKMEVVQEPASSPWEAEPSILGVDDGLPCELDRMRSLGNAVMPAMARMAWDVLSKRLLT